MILFALMAGLAASCAAASTVSWSDLARGARLPHGASVVVTGRLMDLRCGSTAISDVMDVSGITVWYAGQSAEAVVSGSSWQATLGPLAANTAVTLQLKITGRLVASGQELARLAPACAVTPGNTEVFAAGIPQATQSIQLAQSALTQDLSKYAGLDAGTLDAPRIGELRQFYLLHVYPWGPVELDTSGPVRLAQRWSVVEGMSAADVKGGKAFVYGLGFRLNKYFHFTAGGMIYRDAASNRLLNTYCFGPSIDLTALPGLTSIFASQ